MQKVKKILSVIVTLSILGNQVVNATIPTPSELLKSSNTQDEYDKIKQILTKDSTETLIVGANIKGKYCSWSAGWDNVEKIISGSADRVINKSPNSKENKESLENIKDTLLYIINYTYDEYTKGGNNIVSSNGDLRFDKIKEVVTELVKINFGKEYKTLKVEETVNDVLNKVTTTPGTRTVSFINYNGVPKTYDLSKFDETIKFTLDIIDYILYKHYYHEGNNVERLETQEKIMNYFLKIVMDVVDKTPGGAMYKTLVETAIIACVTAYYGINKCNEEKNMEINSVDKEFNNTMSYGLMGKAEMARLYILRTKFGKFPQRDPIVIKSYMENFYKGCFDDINDYTANLVTTDSIWKNMELRFNIFDGPTIKEKLRVAYSKKYCGNDKYDSTIKPDLLAENLINLYLVSSFGNNGIGYMNSYLKLGMIGWEGDILLQNIKNDDFTDYTAYKKSENSCKTTYKNNKTKQLTCVSKIKKVVDNAKVINTFNVFFDRLTSRKLGGAEELDYLNKLVKSLWNEKLSNLDRATIYDTILGKVYQRIEAVKLLVNKLKESESKLNNGSIKQSSSLKDKPVQKQNSNSLVIEKYPNAYNQPRNACETKTIKIGNHEMASCNVGATSTDINSNKSYGYYFQWGNNYGFSSIGNVSTTTTKTDTSSCAPNNCRNTSFFHTSIDYWTFDWSIKENDSLWGGDCSDNISPTSECKLKQRGPCPEGFHIPTNMEWQDLASNNIDTIMQKLPQSGNLQSKAKLSDIAWGAYWSTTLGESGTSTLRSFVFGNNLIYKVYPVRVQGFSIRCFKN